MPAKRTCDCGTCKKCKAKEKCRQTFGNAIQRGKIQRGACEVCGEPNAEGHHEDYAKPFEVRWLCRTHHMAEHRKVA